jgi:hypothetical protein
MARVAKTMKEDLHRTKQKCVGKKMKGFKFPDTKNTKYASCMNEYIGKLGKISNYNEERDEFTVEFKDNYWYYPAKSGLKHIAKEPKTEIVQKPKGKTETVTVDLQAIIDVKNQIIEDLEDRLDEAYKEQEDMLKEVNKWVFQVIHHCAEVESKTGRITLHDVDYCVDLIKRIMKHKFVNNLENY